ncbi:SET domain-containing protein-lysine N-methyltransferase [Dactylosporangium sp. CA-233914]|uniref:SET domain-containing protein-lysine N-methyltransferase n=1 Tax=Dactylosporangium sp. CA-233914 TaxID=3239934 RepID=UPI003D8C6A4F
MEWDEPRRPIAAATHHVDTITVTWRLKGPGNHGCDPSLWWSGPYTLVARRDIAAGEELTNDYATSTADPGFRMPVRVRHGAVPRHRHR